MEKENYRFFLFLFLLIKIKKSQCSEYFILVLLLTQDSVIFCMFYLLLEHDVKSDHDLQSKTVFFEVTTSGYNFVFDIFRCRMDL